MHYQIKVITIYFYEPKDLLLGNITGDIESLGRRKKNFEKSCGHVRKRGGGGVNPLSATK